MEEKWVRDLRGQVLTLEEFAITDNDSPCGKFWARESPAPGSAKEG
jgi:hypothetical protein